MYSQSLNGDNEENADHLPAGGNVEDELPFLPYQKGVGLPTASSIEVDEDLSEMLQKKITTDS